MSVISTRQQGYVRYIKSGEYIKPGDGRAQNSLFSEWFISTTSEKLTAKLVGTVSFTSFA
jgi:hypothetical protein